MKAVVIDGGPIIHSLEGSSYLSMFLADAKIQPIIAFQGRSKPGVSVMPYTAEISRTNPTCFLFLVDQSGSMIKPFGGAVGKIKARHSSDARPLRLAHRIEPLLSKPHMG